MGPIRVGVIGVGSLGQHHARLYADIPEADLVAVVDTHDGRAQAVAAKHRCRALAHLQDLFGQVDAQGVSLVSSTSDVAHARVLFDTGCTATFSASRVAEAKVRELRFYEPESFLVVDLLEQSARIGRCIIGPEGDTKIIAELIRGDRQEALKLELQAFLESVRQRTPPLVSGNDGVAALRLAERIMAQINRGEVA